MVVRRKNSEVSARMGTVDAADAASSPRRRRRGVGCGALVAAAAAAFLAALCARCPTGVDAHVALTYPPARKYDLDFLDNVRTRGPCGMPKGEIRTSLVSGAPFNITWHLAYPHQGGFRLELLDSLERSILDLTPKTETSDFVTGDATAQNFELKFPHTYECKDCTIRLIRQANEWSNKYHFWSCADVDIHKRGSKKVDCNGRGRYLGGRCICERLYYGDRCQYVDECLDDTDCGRQGVCVDVQATTYPKKQCYCRPGYFGEKCGKRSDLKTLANLNLGAFSRRDLSDKLTMYWRILTASRELEVVLQGNGTSYIALGWKPQGLTTNCRLFPHITDPKPEAAQPEPEPEAEPEPEPATEQAPPQRAAAPVPATSRGRPRYRFIDDVPSDVEPAPTTGTPGAAAGPEPEPEVTPEGKKSVTKHEAANPEPEPESEPEPEPAGTTTTPRSVKIDEDKEAADEPEREVTSTEGDSTTATTARPEAKSAQAAAEGSAAEPEPSLEPAANAEPEPEPKSEPEPAANDEPEAKSNDIKSTTTAPEPEPATNKPKVAPTTVVPEPEPEAEAKEPTAEPEPTTTESDYDAETTTTSGTRTKRQAPKLELEGWRPIAPANSRGPVVDHRQPMDEQQERYDVIDRADTGPVEFADQDPHGGAGHDHGAHNHDGHDHAHDHAHDAGGHSHAEPEPAAEPESASAEPEVEPEPASESKSQPAPAAAKPSAENNYAPKGDKKLHPMDCSDIVIGTARGSAHRIGDYYTRDRSTPRLDSFWGNFESDLTAAFGIEENGVTTIGFRRKLDATEPTDHSIVDAEMTVIWARGQEPGQYVHSPHSGLEKGAVSVPDFYKPDEIKYHGQKDQRGMLSMNFFAEDTKGKDGASSAETDFCGGEFRYPRTCSGPDCDYTARWEYDEGSDLVRFTVTTTHTKNRWTGIGFSKDTRMSQSDAVLGWIDRSGRPFIADWWLKGYQAPELDGNQDIADSSVVLEDGVVTLKFTKPRVSTDEQDHSLDQCLHFLYPIKGGDVKAVSKKMGKHDARPEVSAEKICIRSCSTGAGEETGTGGSDGGPAVRVTTARTTTTTTLKPQVVMDVELKVLDVGDNFVVPRRNSPEFRELSDRVKRDVTTALTSVPGFEGVDVTDFESSKENELIAKLVVTLDHNAVSKENKGKKIGGESEKAKEMVSRALEDKVTTGKIGELRVDPQYLKVGNVIVQNEAASTQTASLSDSQLKLYIVIGCIAFLVLIAVMQASCSIYRLKRRNSGPKSHKEGLITNSAWKDYSAATGSTNYAYEHFDPTAAGDERAAAPGNKRGGGGGGGGANGAGPNGRSAGGPRGGPAGPHQQQMRNGSGGYSTAPYGGDTRSLQRPPKNGSAGSGKQQGAMMMSPDRYTNSLPRPTYGAPSHHPGGYYTHDRSRNSYAGPSSSGSGSQAPDFYFMPSQRKYSGEIVRVYVDYNQQQK